MSVTFPGPMQPLAGSREHVPDDAARARLIEVLVRHATHRPDAVAVRDRSAALSYRDLVARAGDLAERIREHGGGPGSTVLLHLPHGAASVVGIVAVLMAGGRYVVADPRAPLGRRRDILAELREPVLLVDPDLDADRDPDTGRRWYAGVPARAVLALRPDAGDGGHAGTGRQGAPPAGRPHPVRPAPDEAYVLFTSGSRGTPKGVRQSVAAVLAMAQNQVEVLGLAPDDRVSLLTSFGYDMAGVDLWSTLLAGATLVCTELAEDGAAETVGQWAAAEVTVVHAAATVWRILLEELARTATRPDRVRLVLIGGEAAYAQDVRRSRALLGQHLAVAHGYGASEVSFVSLAVLEPGDEPRPGQLTAGRPMPGLQVRLSGAGDGECSGVAGAVGEIEVSGPLVALGYLHGPDPAFPEHPDGTRSYRTRDLGTWLPDGSLIVRGRADRQLKVLGHRIEPEELEGVLGSVTGVRACVVVPVRGADGTRLVAYCIPDAGTERQERDLQGLADRVRDAAAQRFPLAVRPVATFLREDLPLTVSGKIDRLSLEHAAAEDLAQSRGSGATPHLCGPLSETTAKVRAAFADVLGHAAESLPVDATFFELGGHSVQLAPLRDRLRSTCPEAAGITVPTILTHQTSTQLAAFLRRCAADRDAPPGEAVVHRAAAATRRALRARKRRG